MATATLPEAESKLARAGANLKYLALGSKAGASAVPASLVTRSTLTTTRYVARFVFWRLVRYLKFAALGAVATAIGGTLLGTLTSAGAFFVAPSAVAGVGIGIGVAVSKFLWRHRPTSIRHFESRILSILPFTQTPPTQSALSSASSTVASSSDAPSSSGFFSWASDRAHEGASAREDEKVEEDRKDLSRDEGARSNRGDVWMRA